MTLPTSGPLTLADIQTEFGGSNPIGLTEYYAGGSYVPAGTTGTNGAVPSSGTISINSFYGTSNIRDFMASTGSAYTYNSQLYASGGLSIILLNSSQNYEMYSSNFNGGDYRWLTAGNVQQESSWKLVVSAGAGAIVSNNVIYENGVPTTNALGGAYIDASGNRYYVYTVASNTALGFNKYNSAGTEVIRNSDIAASTAGLGNYFPYSGQVLTVSSTGAIVISGEYSLWAGGIKAMLWRYTSAGAASFARSFYVGTLANVDWNGMGVITDSSDNIYYTAHGYDVINNNNYRAILVKYNSTGTLQWQKLISCPTGTAGLMESSGVALDGPTGTNVYVAGTYYNSSNVGYYWLQKYNNAGTLQWTRTFNDIFFAYGCQTAVDSNGDIYSVIVSPPYILVFKHTSAGAFVFARSFYISAGTGFSLYGAALNVSYSGKMAIILQMNQSTSPIHQNSTVVKLPNDGSKTGVYHVTTPQGVAVSIEYSVFAGTAGTTPAPTVATSGITITTETQSVTTGDTLSFNTNVPVGVETFAYNAITV